MCLKRCNIYILLCSSIALLSSVAASKSYEKGDRVDVYVNKIGPYANKHETYHYYQLPLCRPLKVVHKSLSLGQVLDGDRMALSSYVVYFGRNVSKTSLCGPYQLLEKDREKLIAAVEEQFYFELVIGDDIRVRSFFGYLDEQNTFPHSHVAYLYTHFVFDFYYDTITKEIAAVELLPETSSAVDLNKLSGNIELFYTVIWIDTKTSTPSQKEKDFFIERTKRVQWMAIFNSSLLVILLVLLVAWILRRVINRDLSRYNEEVDDVYVFENGWKTISADVFRLPKHKNLFAAIIGAGTQFLFLVALVLVIGATSLRSARQHDILNTVALLLYAITTTIAGFVSARLYRSFDGLNWIRNASLTNGLFTVPMLLIWMLNNTVSWAYGSTQALPYTTVIILALLWLCVGYPFTLIGAAIGKNFAKQYSAPCHTRNIPRQLPVLPVYKRDICFMFLGGFLPFSAMSVELYCVFSTVWGRESYTIYYVVLLMMFLVMAVVATSSITLIYYKINSEDYRWWWSAIMIGGSVGFFVFFYGIFFYMFRTDMSGLLQTVQYFSHLFLLCYMFFLTMGTVSFFACHRFVHFIYSSVKTD